MGDPSGDIGPGRIPLGRNQLGDVVKGDNISVLFCIRCFSGYPNDKTALRTAASHIDVPFGAAGRSRKRLAIERREIGNGCLYRLPNQIGFLHSQKTERRAIDERDLAIVIDAHDTGTHPREHRLHEPASIIDLVICLNQGIVLCLELAGHTVERPGERCQIARSLDDIDLGVEIPVRYALRRIKQPHDWRNNAIGEPKTEPDCREQENQGNTGIHQCKGELNTDALIHKLVILGLACPGLLKLIHDPGIHGAIDVEIMRRKRR